MLPRYSLVVNLPIPSLWAVLVGRPSSTEELLRSGAQPHALPSKKTFMFQEPHCCGLRRSGLLTIGRRCMWYVAHSGFHGTPTLFLVWHGTTCE